MRAVEMIESVVTGRSAAAVLDESQGYVDEAVKVNGATVVIGSKNRRLSAQGKHVWSVLVTDPDSLSYEAGPDIVSTSKRKPTPKALEAHVESHLVQFEAAATRLFQ